MKDKGIIYLTHPLTKNRDSRYSQRLDPVYKRRARLWRRIKGNSRVRLLAREPHSTLQNRGGHLGVYSDVFAVAGESETGMVTISFYQTEVPTSAFQMGSTKVGVSKTVNFVSRVVLSKQGAQVLLRALTDNQRPTEEVHAETDNL